MYRTLHLLLALGAVRRVRLGDGAGRFELAEGEGGHHHHLVCEVCGRIEDVRHCPVEGRDLGARVRAHSLELYGLCGACGPARRRRATSARAASGAGPVVRAGRGGGRGTRAGAAG